MSPNTTILKRLSQHKTGNGWKFDMSIVISPSTKKENCSLALDCNRTKHAGKRGSSFYHSFNQFRVHNATDPMRVPVDSGFSRVCVVLQPFCQWLASGDPSLALSASELGSPAD